MTSDERTRRSYRFSVLAASAGLVTVGAALPAAAVSPSVMPEPPWPRADAASPAVPPSLDVFGRWSGSRPRFPQRGVAGGSSGRAALQIAIGQACLRRAGSPAARTASRSGLVTAGVHHAPEVPVRLAGASGCGRRPHSPQTFGIATRPGAIERATAAAASGRCDARSGRHARGGGYRCGPRRTRAADARACAERPINMRIQPWAAENLRDTHATDLSTPHARSPPAVPDAGKSGGAEFSMRPDAARSQLRPISGGQEEDRDTASCGAAREETLPIAERQDRATPYLSPDRRTRRDTNAGGVTAPYVWRCETVPRHRGGTVPRCSRKATPFPDRAGRLRGRQPWLSLSLHTL